MHRKAGKVALAGSVIAALVATLAVTATALARGGASGAQAAPATAAGPAAASANPRFVCRRPQIGLMAPITGDAASIGREQLNWARYAVDAYNRSRTARRSGMRITLVQGDTQLEAAQAATVAQRFASNSRIVGVVGPAGSQEVLASGPIFRRANMAFVSGSATRTDLTTRRFPFFRVVPNDSVQGPTIARYIARTLRSRNVVVIDDQTSYGEPLATSIAANLSAARVSVSRESVNRDQTDFSSLISGMPRNTQVVVLAWQLAARAQTFAQQARAQGRNVTIFGTDGLFQPGVFRVNGSYVASFAPDIRGIPASRAFVTGYTRRFGSNWGTFGPPTHEGVRALINAIRNACAAIPPRATGVAGPRRSEVVLQMRRTLIQPSILGGTLAFTPRGDVRGARFYIFQIRNGRFVTVG